MNYEAEYRVIREGVDKIEIATWKAASDEVALEDYESFRLKCAALSNASTSISQFVPVGCYRIDGSGARVKIV